MEAENHMGGRFDKKGDRCFSTSITSTTLGHIGILKHDGSELYQIEDILFAPSAGATMGLHHITVRSTTKSGVNIGFSNGDHRVTDWALFKKTFARNLLVFSGVDADGRPLEQNISQS